MAAARSQNDGAVSSQDLVPSRFTSAGVLPVWATVENVVAVDGFHDSARRPWRMGLLRLAHLGEALSARHGRPVAAICATSHEALAAEMPWRVAPARRVDAQPFDGPRPPGSTLATPMITP